MDVGQSITGSHQGTFTVDGELDQIQRAASLLSTLYSSHPNSQSTTPFILWPKLGNKMRTKTLH
jgi:hypothetical protein